MLTDTENDPFPVTATQAGFYGTYRNIGARFLLRRGKLDLSRRWMRPLRGAEVAEFFGLRRDALSSGDSIWGARVLSDEEILVTVGLVEERSWVEFTN